MPKNKTHKGLLKRIRLTKTGKVKHKTCGGSHLKSNKSGAEIREYRASKTMSRGEAKRVELLLHTRTRGADQPRTSMKRSPSPEQRKAMQAERKAAAAANA
ncbi:MAG: 50S ribosomal protein L35 [Phycisphaeraceae bacterium]|nr:50S ribosomal protein L35 [Phycisphaeraceae bacterium]